MRKHIREIVNEVIFYIKLIEKFIAERYDYKYYLCIRQISCMYITYEINKSLVNRIGFVN